MGRGAADEECGTRGGAQPGAAQRKRTHIIYDFVTFQGFYECVEVMEQASFGARQSAQRLRQHKLVVARSTKPFERSEFSFFFSFDYSCQ